MDINVDKIRELADLAIEKNLAELKVEDGDKSVTIKLPGAHVIAAPATHPVYAPAHAPAEGRPGEIPQAVSHPSFEEPAKHAAEDRLVKITSPMVGTFYAAPSPDSPPYVTVGQAISKGQTVCIIEAMKMMNELEAEVSGRIVKIVVENGQPVEFGQVLMLVDPA
jgi:acetyl-CoA carboxylase biotin carboxyl carrier protein